MSTRTDDRNCQTAMPTELAHRRDDGLDVLLLWDRANGRLFVVVDDLRHGRSFEVVADGRQALDAFYHPFAYAASRGFASLRQGMPRDPSAADDLAAPDSWLGERPGTARDWE